MKKVIALSMGLAMLFIVAVEVHAALDVIVPTPTSPNTIVVKSTTALVYGTSDVNEVAIENGATAKLIHFPENNRITIQADSSLFMVSRSGAMVIF